MSLNIVSGALAKAAKVGIYGPEGVGKTKLAALFPRPLFFDVELGSELYNLDRVYSANYKELKASLTTLVSKKTSYQTVVIDTGDKVEEMIARDLCARHRKSGIEDFDFGKGYVFLGEEFANFLSLLDELYRQGFHVVVICHSKVIKYTPPELLEGFDRYELRLHHKQVAPLLRDWCDALLFLNYHQEIVKGADKKARGAGGVERILYTRRAPAFDAKSRYSLPEAFFLPPENQWPAELDALIADAPAAADAVSPPAEAVTPPPAEKPAEPAKDPAPAAAGESTAGDLDSTTPEKPGITAEQTDKLNLYGQNSTGGPMIKQRLDELGCQTVADLYEDEAAVLIKEVQDEQNRVSNQTPAQQRAERRTRPLPARNDPAITPSAGKDGFVIWKGLTVPSRAYAWIKRHEVVLAEAHVKWKLLPAGGTLDDLPDEAARKMIGGLTKVAIALQLPEP